MDIREIEQLVKLLERSQISSLEIEEGDKRIRLEKQFRPAPLVERTVPAYENYGSEAGFAPAGGENATLSQTAGSAPAEAVSSDDLAKASAAATRGKAVKSPIVGVFYGAPAPDEDAFVKVGDKVKKGDVLCIIEAMKLMNEITAEHDGEIAEICVENGDVVEFGQPLFYIV